MRRMHQLIMGRPPAFAPSDFVGRGHIAADSSRATTLIVSTASSTVTRKNSLFGLTRKRGQSFVRDQFDAPTVPNDL